MTKIQPYHIDEFTEHLNQMDPNIKFTSEIEEENKLPFLDTCINIKDDGSTSITVYRKPTHTDQYLNFHSNHPLTHKRSVVKTLFKRTEMITEETEKKKEIDHVKNALRSNGYPEWMLHLPRLRPGKKDENERKISIGIPYIKGISEVLARTFKDHGVDMYHKPINTLKSQLVHPKDKVDKTKVSGAIYYIKCAVCEEDYIGETARPFIIRWKEHIKRETSAVHQHCMQTGHHIDLEHAKILETEDNTTKRRVKESIRIRRNKPSLNINEGYEIPPVFLQVLTSRDQSIGQGNS